MKISIARLKYLMLGALLLAVPAVGASAQRSLPRPEAVYGVADLQKLRWLEGKWQGTAPNEKPFYELYHFTSDTLLTIGYYADASFSRQTGNARVYLSGGRIFHISGSARWLATHVDNEEIHFAPDQNAPNRFTWSRHGGDAWTATLRSGAGGLDRLTIYEMSRVK